MAKEEWSWKSRNQSIHYIIINILFCSGFILMIYSTQNDIPKDYDIINDSLIAAGMIGLLLYQYFRKWYMGFLCIGITASLSLIALGIDIKKYLKHNKR